MWLIIIGSYKSYLYGFVLAFRFLNAYVFFAAEIAAHVDISGSRAIVMLSVFAPLCTATLTSGGAHCKTNYLLDLMKEDG